MPEETVEQLLEKFPYLKDFSTKAILVTEQQYTAYQNDEKIKVGYNTFSIQLLKEIITKDEYYEIAKKLFRNEIENIRVCFVMFGDISGNIILNKGDIIKGLDVIISQGLAVFDELAYRRYDELKQEVTYDKFLEKYKGNNYNITIEGQKYALPIDQMIAFLNISSEEFDTICSSPDIKEINGVKKEHYIFAIMRSFKENNLPSKYQFPQTIKEKLVGISTLQKIDIEAVNQITIISDHNIDKIEIHPELKSKILEGLPENASEIEKAIYIYIKMCRLLTYDDEFYAVNQRGESARRHEDINHVREITPENNKVVCYEFNALYGKLLQEIGLTFSTDQALLNGFGGGHANLKFRSDKFLVSADSVTSILQGDIMRAKLNQPLVGLKCVNKNEQSQQEFSSLLTKMYTLIATQTIKENEQTITPVEQLHSEDTPTPEEPQVEHTESFAEILAQYKHTTKQIVHISLSEKLDILMQKVNDSKLVGIDSLSYILHLRKVLFTQEERTENVTITLIRDNELNDENQLATSSAVIAINQNSLTANPESTMYYIYHPKVSFKKISLAELQAKFNEGLYCYIENKDPEVPGVAQGGMKK